MVILVFDPHVKLIIPRNKTLLLDAQNTQDHGLALLWTRDICHEQVNIFTRQANRAAQQQSRSQRARKTA